jgi:hypothetical protein
LPCLKRLPAHVGNLLLGQGTRDVIDVLQGAASTVLHADPQLVTPRVRMVSGLKGENYLEKCQELGLQSLEDLALVHKFQTERRTKTDLFRRTTETERSRIRQADGEQGLTVQYLLTLRCQDRQWKNGQSYTFSLTVL